MDQKTVAKFLTVGILFFLMHTEKALFIIHSPNENICNKLIIDIYAYTKLCKKFLVQELLSIISRKVIVNFEKI